jgi:hypothetical protein
VNRFYVTADVKQVEYLVKSNASDDEIFAESTYGGVTTMSLLSRWNKDHPAKAPGIGIVEALRFESDNAEQ